MKKFKKIIAMGCAAVMAVSAMSMSAFAEGRDTVTSTKYVPYTINYENGYTTITAILAPGEALTPNGIIQLANSEDRVWARKQEQSKTVTRSFICSSEDGDNLNVWVRNDGSVDVKATLTKPSDSSNATVGYGDSGYTFNVAKNGGLSGTYSLRCTAASNPGSSLITVTTEARQFWD